eukprot:6185677-Pleurochrysis_carterae.AAC.2
MWLIVAIGVGGGEATGVMLMPLAEGLGAAEFGKTDSRDGERPPMAARSAMRENESRDLCQPHAESLEGDAGHRDPRASNG